LISLIQTAEGALNETHDILQRMRELSVQSANDTNTDDDRKELQKELDQLANALNDISDDTEFNTKKLLDGNFNATFHVGANEGQNLDISINKMNAEALGVAGKELSTTTIDSDFVVTNERGQAVTIAYTAASTDKDDPAIANSAVFNDNTNTLTITLAQDAGDGQSNAGAITATKDDVLAAINSVDGLTATFASGVDGTDVLSAVGSGGTVSVATETNNIDPDKGINISSQASADEAITTIQTAIDKVSAERSKLGAVQNRLDHTINNLGASAENLTAAESRIRDVDYDLAAA
jgi:flagellin